MTQQFRKADLLKDFHAEQLDKPIDRVQVRWEKKPHPAGEVIRPVHYVYLVGDKIPVERIVDYEDLAKWMYAKFAPPQPVTYEERLKEEINKELANRNIDPYPTTGMVQGTKSRKDVAFEIALALDNFICDHRIDREEISAYLNAIKRAKS